MWRSQSLPADKNFLKTLKKIRLLLPLHLHLDGKVVRSAKHISSQHFEQRLAINTARVYGVLSKNSRISSWIHNRFNGGIASSASTSWNLSYRCFYATPGQANAAGSSDNQSNALGSEENDNKKKSINDGGNDSGNFWKRNAFLFGISMGIAMLLMSYKDDEDSLSGNAKIVSWNDFQQNMLATGEVKEIVIRPNFGAAFIRLHDGAVFKGLPAPGLKFIMYPPDINRLESQIRETETTLGIPASSCVPVTYQRDNAAAWIVLLTMVIFSILAIRALRGAVKMTGGLKMDSFMDPMRKAQYKLIDPHSETSSQAPKVKFNQVAGLHEAKVEVREFLDYLRRPAAFTKLGAKLPKGALLLGPPGCGKTLLAKAVAAECEVPFLAINGTDFVEMIGGLGAARIRSLFADAKKRAPCIIYMDEIDAVGRNRSGAGRAGGMGGSTGEEEQTLNQLLVELDGMDTIKGVIVIASTNRPDILDKALLRRGRFDRHITIDLPNVNERKEIFELYLKGIKIDKPPEHYSLRLAQMTPGFSGADINNVCNEAAIQAVSGGSKIITAEYLDAAMDRILAGSKKRTNTLSVTEKRTVAYHESGHALVGWLLKHTDALLKVTIVPRTTSALGFAQYSPADRKLFTTEELFDRMCMTLGGRAAENVTFGRISTGAENDLKKVTRLAYDQVKVYGMNETIGPLSFSSGGEGESEFMKKPYSKKLQHTMDLEASHLVGRAYRFTENLLTENKHLLERLAETLLKKETLSYEDVKAIIGPPKYGEKQLVELVDQILPSPPEP